MPYRITRRASEARQRQIEAMQRGQEAARMARPEREAVPELPLLRRVINLLCGWWRTEMDDDVIPTEGSRWLHKSGTVYTVALVANLASTRPEEYPPTVVYFSAADVWWCRPLARWHGSMTLLPAQ